jgi:hypothetical protein
MPGLHAPARHVQISFMEVLYLHVQSMDGTYVGSFTGGMGVAEATVPWDTPYFVCTNVRTQPSSINIMTGAAAYMYAYARRTGSAFPHPNEPGSAHCAAVLGYQVQRQVHSSYY